MIQGWKMHKLVNEYKIISMEQGEKLWNFPKGFYSYQNFLRLCFEVCQQLWIFWVIECLYQVHKCKVWSTNTKPFLREVETNLETSQKTFSQFGHSYKFILKSLKSLHGIFWAAEYWLNTRNFQVYSTNRKLFFWSRKKNFETLQKVSTDIRVSYKFILKSV